MKVYWASKRGVVITSANLSTNALGAGDLKEFGVLLPATSIDIDEVIKTLKVRPFSREMGRLERDHRKLWLGSFTWPVTVFVLMLLFWSPLHRLFQALPDALANSETVTLGSLSLRVGKRLSERENQEVRDALAGMDAADIALVAQTSLVGKGVSYGGISSDLVNQ